jgi:hypothetical protein
MDMWRLIRTSLIRTSFIRTLARAGLVLGFIGCASASDEGAALGGTLPPAEATARGKGCGIPECFRAVLCVAECGGEVLQSGCCPCPEGTFDSIVCGSGGGPVDQ